MKQTILQTTEEKQEIFEKKNNKKMIKNWNAQNLDEFYLNEGVSTVDQ